MEKLKSDSLTLEAINKCNKLNPDYESKYGNKALAKLIESCLYETFALEQLVSESINLKEETAGKIRLLWVLSGPGLYQILSILTVLSGYVPEHIPFPIKTIDTDIINGQNGWTESG